MLLAPRRALGLALSTLVVLGCGDDRGGATTPLTTPPLTTFSSDPGDSNADDSDPPNTGDTGSADTGTPTSSSDPASTSDPTTSDPITSDPSTTSSSETTDPTRPDPSTTTADTGIDESTGSTTDEPPSNADQPASGLFSGCQVQPDCDDPLLCWTSSEAPMPDDGYCTTLCFSDAECGAPLAVPAQLVCFNADMGFGICAYVCSLDLECPTGMLCKPSGLNPGTNLCY